MKPECFTTRTLPSSEQFEAWSCWQDSVFDTRAVCPPDSGFLGDCSIWKSNGWGLSRVRASAIGINRTRRHIRRSPIDHWVVTLTLEGTSELTVCDQSLMPPAGLPFIVSLADELSNERSSYDQLQLFLARDEFHSIAPLLDSVRGTVMDTSRGKLLADYLLMLERHLPTLELREVAQLRPAIEAMVRTCLSSQEEDDASTPVGSLVGLTRMERIRRVVRARLRSPSLTPLELCRETGISRPALYRLLEGEGGAVHYIRRRRLQESFRLLRGYPVDYPVSRIAQELCLGSASAFSRAFREEFGVSPSDVRANALAGLEPIRAPKVVDASGSGRLAGILRQL